MASGGDVRRRRGERVQLAEFAQAGDATREEAGVDGPGDPWRCLDGGEHRKIRDLAHVPRREAAAFLGDEDDPVWPRPAVGQQRGEGEVARAPEHDVCLGAFIGEPVVEAAVLSAIDDDRGGRQRRGRCDEHEVRGDFDRLASLDGWHTQECGCALMRRRDEHGVAVACGMEGQSGGDRRGALAASCAGDHALTWMDVRGRRGAGRASPTRPVTPSGLMGGGHWPATTISSSAW